MTRPITPRKTKLIPRIADLGGRVRHLEVNGPPQVAGGVSQGFVADGTSGDFSRPLTAGAQTDLVWSTGANIRPVAVTGIYLAVLRGVIASLSGALSQAPTFKVLGELVINGGAADPFMVYCKPAQGAGTIYSMTEALLGTLTKPLYLTPSDVMTVAVYNQEAFDVFDNGHQITLVQIS